MHTVKDLNTKTYGLQCRVKMKKRKQTDQSDYIAENHLKRDFSATKPLEKLVTDKKRDAPVVPPLRGKSKLKLEFYYCSLRSIHGIFIFSPLCFIRHLLIGNT
ncbi:transposase, orfB, IS3 family protein [Bacillus xiamenensis]|nr:transposase, orfB, IS3 family protein [Bacillus xiamenensis]